MEQRFSNLIIKLASGVSQRRLYFDNHPRVVTTSHEVAYELAALIREEGLDSLEIGVFNSKLVRDGLYLVGPSIAGRALINFAERLRCGGFAFHMPLEPDHMTRFFRLGAMRLDRPANLEQAQALMDRNGLSQVKLLAPLSEMGDCEESTINDQERSGEDLDGCMDFVASEFTPLLQVYQTMFDSVADNIETVLQSSAVDLDQARQAGFQLIGLPDQEALDVMQFLRYPDYDSYTIGHSVRVAALMAMLGRRLGWSKDVLATLATAGLLHDLGKGRIPGDILFKVGDLTEEERQLIKAHPTVGAKILLDCGETDPVIISAAWGHHIRHDGGGYPTLPFRGYRAGAVAELVHVCDVFEALTACRPYKKPMTPRKAYQVMLRDQNDFHPTILAEFISAMGIYPPGSQVHLNDGTIAVVLKRGRSLDRPVVKTISDAHELPLPRDRQDILDLTEEPEVSIVDILSQDGELSLPV